MISPDDIRNTLARCAAYDPSHFPKPSEAIADVWFEHMTQYRHLTGDDLRNAVREYYNKPEREVPKPADISTIARKYSRERFERSEIETKDHPASVERQQFEALCDSKAAPDLPELESGHGVRQQAIESFARRFGISPAEAAVRMDPRHGTVNEMDARAIEVSHVRMSMPPAPLACPDCGSTDVPCPCDVEEECDG